MAKQVYRGVVYDSNLIGRNATVSRKGLMYRGVEFDGAAAAQAAAAIPAGHPRVYRGVKIVSQIR